MPVSWIGERYCLEEEIGRGGKGIVYRAFDTLLQRFVAVKVLLDRGLDPEQRARERQRLLYEAQAAARLNHPNIVAVYDAGINLPGDVGEATYLVMELVDGPSLHQRPPTSLEETLSIARQLCTALEHAHTQGIIHRDMKPENVLLSADGTAKLNDFGLASSQAASRLTEEGRFAGSVLYLAPEQAMGGAVDARTDLYALGVLLYELVAGRVPFTADDPLAVISQHLYAAPVPPRAFNESLSPALDTLILRLLSKRPEDRPASAQEVRMELESAGLAEAHASLAAAELPLLDRIARGRMVGRERELSMAMSLWLMAASGAAQVLVIGGEPGVGKTRLALELAAGVQVRGGRVLTGECFAEGGAPYTPFAPILLRAAEIAGTDRLAQLPSPVLAGLINLQPALQEKFPQVPANPPLDPQAERQRLFDSTAALFQHLALAEPLLVLLEDVHWADRGTLALARHLARAAARHRLRLLLVMTYRETELSQNPALEEVLYDLTREHLSQILHLASLDRQCTQALLGTLFAEEITPEFLDGIYQATEGNPFFIEEVCKGLIEAGQLTRQDGRWRRPSMEDIQIPQSLRMVVGSRLARLPQPAQELLSLAAAIGREFDFETLQAASGKAEDALLDGLEAAERAQLIAEVRRPGDFAFAHALFPMVLNDSLGIRRRRTHRQVAKAILALHPENYERLAYHYEQAGDVAGARRFHLLAGDRARRLAVLETAAEHYARALDSWPEDDLQGRAETMQRLGDCLWLIQDLNRTLETFQEVYNLYERSGDRVHAGQAEGSLGRIHWELGQREQAMDHYQRALAILEAGEETVELAQAISAISQMNMLASRFDAAIESGERALALAEKLEAREGIIHALNNIGSARCHVAAYDPERGLEMLRRSLRMSWEDGAPHGIARAALNLGEMLVSLGQYPEAHRTFEEGHAYFARIHARGFSELLLMRAIELDWRIGRWAEALPSLAQFGEAGDSVYSIWIRTGLALINNDLGQPRRAYALLESALDGALSSDEAQTMVPFLAQLARACTALGETERSEAWIRRFLERLDADPYFFWGLEKSVLFACQWYTAHSGSRAQAEVGGAAVDGALESAHQCVERLERVDRQMQTGATGAALAEGRALVALASGETLPAVEGFRAAAASWKALSHPLDRARALVGLSRAYQGAGDTPSARLAFDTAQALLDDLANGIENPELRKTFKEREIFSQIGEQAKLKR